mmetsp:Transcript_13031/g.28541  ORF Transcript_13031/g.28541 Transcript_13031/m.28541 type:complete len:235 (-) Transcript_13031:173-877(-)
MFLIAAACRSIERSLGRDGTLGISFQKFWIHHLVGMMIRRSPLTCCFGNLFGGSSGAKSFRGRSRSGGGAHVVHKLGPVMTNIVLGNVCGHHAVFSVLLLTCAVLFLGGRNAVQRNSPPLIFRAPEVMPVPKTDLSSLGHYPGFLDNLVECMEDAAARSSAPAFLLNRPGNNQSTHFPLLDNVRELFQNVCLQNLLVILGFRFHRNRWERLDRVLCRWVSRDSQINAGFSQVQG